MRLIDADGLMCDVMGLTIVSPETMNYANAVAVAITNAPTIEAEPVRHGRWIDGMPYTNSHWKVCSVCHKSADHPAGGHEYCGHCGAKMDGGADVQTG